MQLKSISLQTIILTLILLVFGGLIQHDSGSLVCDSWPLCKGIFNGKSFIELFHRALASVVGLSTVWILIQSFKKKLSFKLKRLAAFSLFFLVLQGVLGAVTAIYKLPSDVSIIHLLFSIIYLGLLVNIHHELTWKKITVTNSQWSGNYRYWMIFAILILLFQFFLGGLVKHTGASAACGLGLENALSCVNMGTWNRTWWPSNIPAQINMLHRLFAIFGSIYLFSLVFSLFKRLLPLEEKGVKSSFYLVGIFSVLLAEMFSGLGVTAFNLSRFSMAFHLLLGVFLLGLVWKLYLIFTSIQNDNFKDGAPTFISDLLDLTKPRLGALVMITCLVGVLIAPKVSYFGTSILSFFLTAMVVMSATTLNCYMEKEVDKLMERTKNRPLPTGRLNPNVALVFGVLLLLISIPALWFLVNPVTAILGLVAHLLYLIAYTPLKRKSVWALYVGAIPGAIPPVMGWTTVMGEFDAMGQALFAILFVWQLPHFMAISIYHQKDYESAGIAIYPSFCSPRLMKHLIFWLTIALSVTSFIPYAIGFFGTSYLVVALLCNALFLGISVKGFSIKNDQYIRWAKQYFWGSIIYLPLLLGSMIVVK